MRLLFRKNLEVETFSKPRSSKLGWAVDGWASVRLVKADRNTEAGVLPDEKLVREMGK